MSASTDVTITRFIQVQIPETEKREKHEELVRTINDLKRLEENFGLLKEQHKANLKSRQTKINELSNDLGAGYVMRPVACEQVVDIERNRLVTKRIDTGDVVDDRALTVEEMKQFRKPTMVRRS